MLPQVALERLLPGVGLEGAGLGAERCLFPVGVGHAFVDEQAVFLFQHPGGCGELSVVVVRFVRPQGPGMNPVVGHVHVEIVGVDVGTDHPLMLLETERLGKGLLDVLEILLGERLPLARAERDHQVIGLVGHPRLLIADRLDLRQGERQIGQPGSGIAAGDPELVEFLARLAGGGDVFGQVGRNCRRRSPPWVRPWRSRLRPPFRVALGVELQHVILDPLLGGADFGEQLARCGPRSGWEGLRRRPPGRA